MSVLKFRPFPLHSQLEALNHRAQHIALEMERLVLHVSTAEWQLSAFLLTFCYLRAVCGVKCEEHPVDSSCDCVVLNILKSVLSIFVQEGAGPQSNVKAPTL